ncbi:MAG: ribonuclease H family protein [Bacteroidales bacterium]
MILIYTDGSANTLDRSGGWAFVLQHSDKEIHCSNFLEETTNNRMEMSAIFEALNYVKENLDYTEGVKIVSDSKYAISGLTTWRFGWERTNFKNGECKNIDLWKLMYPLVDLIKPTFEWVKGHSGNRENELCDTLAHVSRVEKIGSLTFHGLCT